MDTSLKKIRQEKFQKEREEKYARIKMAKSILDDWLVGEKYLKLNWPFVNNHFAIECGSWDNNWNKVFDDWDWFREFVLPEFENEGWSFKIVTFYKNYWIFRRKKSFLICEKVV